MAPLKPNLLLDSLPPASKASLLARLEPVSLALSQDLYKPGVAPTYVHFVTSGLVSIVTFMEDGDGVEVGLIGREGFPEAFHLLGEAGVPTNAFMQVEGTALRMPFADFHRDFQSIASIRDAVLRFVQSQSLILGQVAACNRLHEVEERLARWLLMVSDRLGESKFHLTQEFLAEMIGAQRSTVTLAAGNLQRSGLIEYRRGNIDIINRPGLEAAACECYPIVRDLLPVPVAL